MNINLLDVTSRKQVLEDIKSQENLKRKSESLKDYEIYNDRIYPYVYEKLAQELGADTACKMPIVSTLNIAKRIVKSEATIYTNDPKRTISEAKESDALACELLYKDRSFNSKLQKSNAYYKQRNQSFIQVVPKDKSIDLRVLLGHQVDVIPDFADPEKAYAYIISSFDKSSYLKSGQDNINQLIADTDDYKKSLERYLVWTAEYNFIMNGNGLIISEVLNNEIGELPFIDVSKDKDFEFFIRLGQALSDFTIQYNAAWSDNMYIQRMEGFSIGVVTGDPELKPASMSIGPGNWMFLPVNKDNPESKIDIKFVNPSPNLDANLKNIKELLADFLMTRGVDQGKISSAMNGTKSYSSAIERLLAMIDEFESTKEDFDLYESVEIKLFNIIKKYLVKYTGTDLLEKKYWVSNSFDKTEMSVQFHKPEMIETYSEKLMNAQAKIDLGIADQVSVLMELEGIDETEAQKRIDDINKRKQDKLKLLVNGGIDATNQTKNIGIGSQPDNKP